MVKYQVKEKRTRTKRRWRREGQLIKYKMVKYRIKVKANKNEEKMVVEVVEKEEEVVGQEGDNDEQKMKTMQVK